MFGKKLGNKGEITTEGEITDILPILGEKMRLGKKAPVEYEDMKQKEREEVKSSRETEARDLLIKTIEYNNKHGNKTALKLTEKNNIKVFLKNLSEEKQYEVNRLLTFAHDPLCPECKTSHKEGTTECIRCEVKTLRFIVTIPDHDKMNYIGSLLKKFIPGFTEQLKIIKLQKELSLATDMIKELEEIRDKKRRGHKERIETSKEIVKMPELTPETPEIPIKHVCSVCERDFKNAGGLGNHMKSKHPEEYEKLKKE